MGAWERFARIGFVILVAVAAMLLSASPTELHGLGRRDVAPSVLLTALADIILPLLLGQIILLIGSGVLDKIVPWRDSPGTFRRIIWAIVSAGVAASTWKAGQSVWWDGSLPTGVGLLFVAVSAATSIIVNDVLHQRRRRMGYPRNRLL